MIAKERKIWEAERVALQVAKNVSLAAYQSAQEKGRCLTQQDRFTARTQANCTHRKGGTIRDLEHPASALYQGDSPHYAVIKHQVSHGDIWVRCLRCGKWWKPPIRSQYKLDRDFWRAMFEYEAAVNFETNNITSSSVQIKFHTTAHDGTRIDATEIVREKLANSAGY
jgi:hypothetical protein